MRNATALFAYCCAAALHPQVIGAGRQLAPAFLLETRYKTWQLYCRSHALIIRRRIHYTLLTSKALCQTRTCWMGLVTCCRTWQPYLGFHAMTGVGMPLNWSWGLKLSARA